MIPEEITKLAVEYVEELYPREDFEDIRQMFFLREMSRKNAAHINRWLLRTHCIVEKIKVREAHEVYRREWIESKDCNKVFQNLIRMETLEQLFDPDTLNKTDK